MSEIEKSTISKGLIIPIESSEGKLSEFIIVRTIDEKFGINCVFFYLNTTESIDLIREELTKIGNKISEYQASKGEKSDHKKTSIISFQNLFNTPGIKLGKTFGKIFELLGKFYHEHSRDLDENFFKEVKIAIDNFIEQSAVCEESKKVELVQDIIGKYGKILESVEYKKVLEIQDRAEKLSKERLEELKRKLIARNLGGDLSDTQPKSDLSDTQDPKRAKIDIADSNTEAAEAQPAAVDAAEASAEEPAADAEKPTVLPLITHIAGREA